MNNIVQIASYTVCRSKFLCLCQALQCMANNVRIKTWPVNYCNNHILTCNAWLAASTSTSRRCWGSISSASGTDTPNKDGSNSSTSFKNPPNRALVIWEPLHKPSKSHRLNGTEPMLSCPAIVSALPGRRPSIEICRRTSFFGISTLPGTMSL